MDLAPPHREWFHSNVPSYQLGKRVVGFRQSITDMCRGRHNHFTDCHWSRAVTPKSDPSLHFLWHPEKDGRHCRLTASRIGWLIRLKNRCVSNLSKPLNTSVAKISYLSGKHLERLPTDWWHHTRVLCTVSRHCCQRRHYIRCAAGCWNRDAKEGNAHLLPPSQMPQPPG